MKNTKCSKNKNRFSHIKKAERYEIALLINKQYSYNSIAEAMDRSVSTISDEIKRNSVKGVYDPNKADHKAYVKRKYAKYESMKIVANDKLKNYVTSKINEDWSPEIISGRIKFIDTHIPYASHRVIYKYIDSPYGRKLENKLTRKYKKKTRKRVRVTKLKDRVFIDKRPKNIDERVRYGDWEGDFIVSGRDGSGVLFVLYERKSRYVIIKKLLKTDHDTISSYLKLMTGGSLIFESLTLDNDIAFRKHAGLSKLMGVPIYFCHPYHSWEKGGVESVNGLIRRYVIKGSNISKYSDEFIQEVENKLNDRPRKCLKFRTPQEIMDENFKIKRRNIKIGYLNKNNGVFGLGV